MNEQIKQMRAKVEAEIALLNKKWGNKRCSMTTRMFACIRMLALKWVLRDVLKP